MGILNRFCGTIGSIVRGLWSKPKVSDFLMVFLTWIPQLLVQVQEYAGMGDKAKIDDLLHSADALTGIDEGATDIFRDLPADKEEELFDYAIEIVRILAYNRCRVSGYYIDESGTRDYQAQFQPPGSQAQFKPTLKGVKMSDAIQPYLDRGEILMQKLREMKFPTNADLGSTAAHAGACNRTLRHLCTAILEVHETQQFILAALGHAGIGEASETETEPGDEPIPVKQPSKKNGGNGGAAG